MTKTAGQRFRELLDGDLPLQIVGTINAFCALQAQHAGFQSIYLSGAGVANASYGMPDLGVTSLSDVLVDVRRITSTVDLPLLVDVDTGWGTAIGIARTIREMTRAGVAAVHMEDQVEAKRCGHRPGKMLVETGEMVDRIRSAVDARLDESFFLIARTDAAGVEGLDAAIERAGRYVDAGADGIFAEALQSADEIGQFVEAIDRPVLINLTEFGRTPLLPLTELQSLGVSMALYPLSAFRAMSQAAEQVYQTIRRHGTQTDLINEMQTRDRLYELLDYRRYEDTIDRLFAENNDE